MLSAVQDCLFVEREKGKNEGEKDGEKEGTMIIDRLPCTVTANRHQNRHRRCPSVVVSNLEEVKLINHTNT